jgi:hypothetical protein
MENPLRKSVRSDVFNTHNKGMWSKALIMDSQYKVIDIVFSKVSAVNYNCWLLGKLSLFQKL